MWLLVTILDSLGNLVAAPDLLEESSGTFGGYGLAAFVFGCIWL